jgi:hypothetical protein
MLFQIDLTLDYRYAFAFEESFLQRGVRLADKDFAAFAENAMPGDAFAGGRGSHGAPRGASAAAEAQNPGQCTIR